LGCAMRKMTSSEDMELFDAWCNGNQAAGSALFERYFESVYIFFYNKISDDIEDLTQETFLACVQGRDRFRGDASFRTYLFRTAHNLLYKAYRKRGRDGAMLDFSVITVQDLAPSPRSLVGHKREHQLLLEALRQIPLDYQIALELYYWEGLSGPDLASALEVGLPAARSRLRRGIEHLRNRMAKLAGSETVPYTEADIEEWARSIRDAIVEQSTFGSSGKQ